MLISMFESIKDVIPNIKEGAHLLIILSINLTMLSIFSAILFKVFDHTNYGKAFKLKIIAWKGKLGFNRKIFPSINVTTEVVIEPRFSDITIVVAIIHVTSSVLCFFQIFYEWPFIDSVLLILIFTNSTILLIFMILATRIIIQYHGSLKRVELIKK